MKLFFEEAVEKALPVIQAGGVILYPTDTIWGLGCDATNENAVQRLYTIKERAGSKSLIILLADSRDLLHYVAAPDPDVFDYIEQLEHPTTIIFENAIGLSQNVIASDGSIGIRIVKDAFCRHLIKRLRKPLVSTSANYSGMPAPRFFADISDELKNTVDYIVPWRQEETIMTQPSRIVRWVNGTAMVLRP